MPNHGTRTTPLSPPELRSQAREIVYALAQPPTRTAKQANDALVEIEKSHERLRSVLLAAPDYPATDAEYLAWISLRWEAING